VLQQQQRVLLLSRVRLLSRLVLEQPQQLQPLLPD
jgi:hypothetical protein